MIFSGGVEAWEGDTVSVVWCFLIFFFLFLFRFSKISMFIETSD